MSRHELAVGCSTTRHALPTLKLSCVFVQPSTLELQHAGRFDNWQNGKNANGKNANGKNANGKNANGKHANRKDVNGKGNSLVATGAD